MPTESIYQASEASRSTFLSLCGVTPSIEKDEIHRNSLQNEDVWARAD